MKKTILIMGSPGTGKGTFSAKLVSEYGVCYISTGDIFRYNIKNKTAIGAEALKFINEGKLVPDSITDTMVLERLQLEDAKQNGILLDGYPRNIHQAKEIVKALATINRLLDTVIWLDTPTEVIIKRIINRRTCKGCGKVYNIITMTPKKEGVCDKCGEDIYQRSDDTLIKVKARLAEYVKSTLPLLSFYKDSGLLEVVDSNVSIEEAYVKIKNILEDK